MINIIVQARMSSSRFPGKMMHDFGGVPLYEYVLERCLSIPGNVNVILATSEDDSDTALAEEASDKGYSVFRGSLNDVLGRFVDCCEAFGFQHVVRVCGDSPFVDIELIHKYHSDFTENQLGYLGFQKNYITAGLDFEIVSMELLVKIHKLLPESAPEREHVTQFIRNNPQMYDLTLVSDEFLPILNDDVILTVDYKKDYEYQNKLATKLKSDYGYSFTTQQLIKIQENME
jgi:spore coat polysaccharide biosynthesis protein SpsF (cytidylyltransferase family)